MNSENTLAIILRAIPYEERHQVVNVLSEKYGKISALAKNSIQSRRFGSSLQPLTASMLTLQKKESSDLYFLTEAEVKHEFLKIREDLTLFSIGALFSEIMLRLAPENQVSADHFKLHSNALFALEECEGDLRKTGFAVLDAYMIKCLQIMGVQPLLHECLSCKKNLMEMPVGESVLLQIESAGWYCADCAHGHADRTRSLNVMTLRDLLVLSQLPIRQASLAVRVEENALAGAFPYLEALLIFHVPGFDRTPIKSLKLLGLKSNLLPD